jgi:hypothetical protein
MKKQNKFYIKLTHLARVERSYMIEAESEEEAVEKTMKMYYSNEDPFEYCVIEDEETYEVETVELP